MARFCGIPGTEPDIRSIPIFKLLKYQMGFSMCCLLLAGEPVRVGVSMFVLSICSVSEVLMVQSNVLIKKYFQLSLVIAYIYTYIISKYE